MGGGSEGTFHEVAGWAPAHVMEGRPCLFCLLLADRGGAVLAGSRGWGGQARGEQPAGGGLLFHCLSRPGVWQTWTSATLLHQTYKSPVGVQLHQSTASHQLHRHRQKHESAESPVSPSPTSDPTLPYPSFRCSMLHTPATTHEPSRNSQGPAPSREPRLLGDLPRRDPPWTPPASARHETLIQYVLDCQATASPRPPTTDHRHAQSHQARCRPASSGRRAWPAQADWTASIKRFPSTPTAGRLDPFGTVAHVPESLILASNVFDPPRAGQAQERPSTGLHSPPPSFTERPPHINLPLLHPEIAIAASPRTWWRHLRGEMAKWPTKRRAAAAAAASTAGLDRASALAAPSRARSCPFISRGAKKRRRRRRRDDDERQVRSWSPHFAQPPSPCLV
jgi:hypothetical protein